MIPPTVAAGAAGGAGAAGAGAGGAAGGEAMKALSGGGAGGGGGDSAKKIQTAVQVGLGTVEVLAGIIKKRKGNAIFPQFADPRQIASLNYSKARRRSFVTGTANSRNLSELSKVVKSAQSQTFNSGGGTRTGLNYAGEIFNKGMLALNQTSINGETFYDQQVNKTLEDIVQRELDLRISKSQQLFAESAQNFRAGESNILAAAANNVPVTDENAKKKKKSGFADTESPLASHSVDLYGTGAVTGKMNPELMEVVGGTNATGGL